MPEGGEEPGPAQGPHHPVRYEGALYRAFPWLAGVCLRQACTLTSPAMCRVSQASVGEALVRPGDEPGRAMGGSRGDQPRDRRAADTRPSRPRAAGRGAAQHLLPRVVHGTVTAWRRGTPPTAVRTPGPTHQVPGRDRPLPRKSRPHTLLAILSVCQFQLAWCCVCARCGNSCWRTACRRWR